MKCRILSYCALGLSLAGTAFAADAVIKLSLNGGACVVDRKAPHVGRSGKVRWTVGSGVRSFQATFNATPFDKDPTHGSSHVQNNHDYQVMYPCKLQHDGIGCAFPYSVEITTTTGQTVKCDPDIIIDPMQ